MTELALIREVTPGAIGIWVLVFMLLIALVKGWPKLLELMNTRDASLRKDLTSRIAKLERDANKFERRLEAERQRHEAEMRILRHRLTNETASLDALLLLLETSPEKVSQSVSLIKEMRSRRADNVATEQAALVAMRHEAARLEEEIDNEIEAGVEE